MGLGKVYVRQEYLSQTLLTKNRSVRINGADCGIEAIMLGVVTSIGGFLFGYDTVRIPFFQKLQQKLR